MRILYLKLITSSTTSVVPLGFFYFGASGYWEVPVQTPDRANTAFVTPDGLFQYKQMPFGPCKAPATFQRLIDSVFGRLKWYMCVVYMDDV